METQKRAFQASIDPLFKEREKFVPIQGSLPKSMLVKKSDVPMHRHGIGGQRWIAARHLHHLLQCSGVIHKWKYINPSHLTRIFSLKLPLIFLFSFI